ncbi:MAG: flavin reductase [Flavobacteriaceae bacterium]|jgi:flavin reductase (DIM6/NTAB) family NADH-FMN oxidoreductase RutF|nr:flavin reductase [Flavobacteriaceae bacterium]
MQKKKWSLADIEVLEKKKRLHLINSCTGYKSANLIGSISSDGVENLAVFSSIVHLGSDPAFLGFILRPTTVPRHSFANILETGYFTVNHVNESIYKKGHDTSLSYPKEQSEFEIVGLTPEYQNDFIAPFVKEASVKIGCKYSSHYDIKENGTILVTGQIISIEAPVEAVDHDLFIDLSRANTLTINGLDGYAKTQTIERIPYKKL